MTRTVALPLSFEQEWFYLRHLLRPEESYPLTIAYDLSGHLDTRAFWLALHGVVARHQAMRLTVGGSDPGAPQQWVIDPGEMVKEPVTQVVKCESRAQFQAYATALARHDLQLRWDPRTGPQHYFRLLRRSDTEHIFISTFSHIEMDLTALIIFERELWMLYAHHANGAPIDSDEPRGLADAIHAQTDRYQARARSKNIEYWDRRIATMPPVWQYAYPPPSEARGATSESMSVQYSDFLIRRLQLISRDLGCSIFHLILSVTAWLAFQLTYQDRLAVNVVVDARNMADKSVLGMFSAVRPVVFQRADGGPVDFLGQARNGVMLALAHHYVHGADEIAAVMRLWSRWGVEPRRALSVNYIKGAARIAERTVPPDVRARSVDYAPSVAGPAGLGLVVFDTEDTLRVIFNYDPSKIPESAVLCLVETFEKGLGAIARLTDDTGADGLAANGLRPAVARTALAPLHDRSGATVLHVDLHEVHAMLIRHPRILAADVRVAGHPDGGSEVVAHLQVTSPLSADELRDFCVHWPATSPFALPPTRISQTIGGGRPEPVAGHSPLPSVVSAVLQLLVDVLPGTDPESEFWASGGSFSAISELISRAVRAGLPKPHYRHFAAPCSLAGIAERIAAAERGE